MRGLLFLALILATPTTTQACWRCRRPRPQHSYPAAAATQRPATLAPRVAQSPAPAQWSATDEAGAFLSALNIWRNANGRSSVGWDAGLAAWAAVGTSTHSVMVPGAGQCWSGYSSLTASLEAWKSSPAHAAILLNATVAVGASPCPSGATCNAR